MANFTTHIGVGTIAAGALATLTLAADVVAPENLVAVTMAGVLGSVLPDIDLKDSRPSKAMFAGLAVFFSFAVLFEFAAKYSIAELWLVWLGTLVAVRYGLFWIFHHLSVHRGIWHSLLGAAFSGVFTAIIFYRLLGRPDGVAWLAGGFLVAGYLVHLALDEIYSVDVMDTRVKASFGTAMKVFDKRYPWASAGMAAALVAAVLVSPPVKTFHDGMSSQAMWNGLQRRLLPRDSWFGVVPTASFAARHAAPAAAPSTNAAAPAPTAQAPAVESPAAHAPAGAAITTGSIPDAPRPAPSAGSDGAATSEQPAR